MLFCFSAAFAAEKSGTPKTKPVFVIIDGNVFSGVSAYAVTDKTNFFHIKEVAEIYNANTAFGQVSKRATLTFPNNKTVVIRGNTKEVFFGKTSAKTEMPSRVINGELYISPEILTLKEFAEAAEAETAWNSKTNVLNVIPYTNISAVRYFTRPEETQVIIEMDENLPYTVSKATGSIILNVHRGKVQKDFVYANNGAIMDILYNTEGKDAVFKINLQQTPKLVKISKLKNPYRIAVDIEHSLPVDITMLANSSVPEAEEYDTLPDYLKDSMKLQAEDSAESEITETLSPIEFGQDNQDLAKVTIVRFEEQSIVDDSYAIIDDLPGIEGLLPENTVPKKKLLKKKRIIVVDAGHGGEDPGAVGPNGTREKNINLSIARELAKILRNDTDYEVIMTRSDDTFIPLVERTKVANDNKADLFVSIHCNASFNKSASGFEVYFLSEKATDEQSAATARLENSVIELEGKPSKKRSMLQEMLWSMMVNEHINESSELGSFIAGETPGRMKIPNRGVRQANFYVLRGAQMPAVLVESAFISNYSDESKLNRKNFQIAAADSIYEGIKKYYARKDKIKPKTK